MKLTDTMIKAIICILMLRFADMANIAEKKRVYTRTRLSRNSRSNAKAREISTIITVSLKVVSFLVKGYIDNLIVDKYKSLKTHLEAADENAKNTQIFVNQFNGEKCTYYNRFGILNKSIHFFFKFQKFKNEVINFSTYLDDLILSDNMMEEIPDEFPNLNTKVNQKPQKIVVPQSSKSMMGSLDFSSGSDLRSDLNSKKNSLTEKRQTQNTKNFLQIGEKFQKKRRSLRIKYQNKETAEEKRKTIKELRETRKESLKQKLKIVQAKLEENLSTNRPKLFQAFDIIEEGMNRIQEKTDQLISLYCTAHAKGLSDEIAQIRSTIKKELDDVNKKIDDHLKNSNFLTNALQFGFFSAAKNEINNFLSSNDSPKEQEEEIDGFLGKVEIGTQVAGNFAKLPANVIFKGTEYFKKFEKLEIGDVVNILEGGKVPAKFKGLSKGLIESTITEGEIKLFKATDKIGIIGDTVGGIGAFTGLVVSIFTANKTLKPDADDIAKFKHKMNIFNGFFGNTLNLLEKFEKFSPIFKYVSAVKSVAEMFTKYLEYRTVVQYVEKKIGFVNNLTTQLRMKTLKYMANEVQNRCDLLMNSYDILNKNKNMFIKIFSDSKATNLEMYFNLKHKITKFENENNKNIDEESKLKLEEFKNIEKDFFENIMDSNSMITASAADLITANTAYLLRSEDFDNAKKSNLFKMRNVYGSFNKLLVATSPEQYKSLMEVGYEIIFHLGNTWLDIKNGSKFNFVMGCRGCGDEVISYFTVFPLEKFNSMKDKILKNIQDDSEDSKINYLTYDHYVVAYSTYKKKIIHTETESPFKKNESCFLEAHFTKTAFRGVLNFDHVHKYWHGELAELSDENSYYVDNIRTYSQIYCQDISFSVDIIKIVYNHKKTSNVFENEETKNGVFSQFNFNHKQYVLTYEILEFNHNQVNFSLKKDNTKLQEKLLLNCTKTKGPYICYYLKPVPEKNVDEFLSSNMPYIESLTNKSNKYDKTFIKNEKFNFFGKTFVLITNLFNKEFPKGFKKFDENDREKFLQNLNLGEDIELIEVRYQLKKDGEDSTADYFIMYDKEKIINKSQSDKTDLSSNSEATEKAKAFSDAVDELKKSVCEEKLCNNFFKDGNKRERYLGLSQELSIYNSFYNDYASQLNESSSKSNTDSNFEKFVKYISDYENSEYRTFEINFNDETQQENFFSKIVQGMIKKTYGGYFLDFGTDAILSDIRSSEVLIYKKNNKIIIPPLMKIFGDDHNIFTKAFNFVTFNSEKNNKVLNVLDLKNFETTFNDACHTSVRQNDIKTSEILNFYHLNQVFGKPAISPFFSLIINSKKIDEHGNEQDLFQLNEETKLTIKPNMKWDIDEYCVINSNNKKYPQICILLKKYPDFKRFYNTFISTGQDFQIASDFKIVHKDKKEKTIIPLSKFFYKYEMKETFFNKCGYVIINIPMFFDHTPMAYEKANYYYHVDFNFDQYNTNESKLEFHMSDKPGFNDLVFIQIIFNKTPKEKMNTFLQYNDSIASLFGYSYAKNKKQKELIKSQKFDEMDFDDYSFPILTKDQKKNIGIEKAVFKAKIVKMKDLSTSYKREDICGKE